MVLDAGSGTQTNGGNKSAWSLFSLFCKADYNYNNTYLLSATFRRDASSVLGKTNNSGVFPAFSGAWRISEEPFFPKINAINYLKFRAGWGETGNSSIGSYATYSDYAYNIGNGAYPLNGTNSSTTGITVSSTGNPNLKWETTTQLNLGFDAALFNSALNVSFDYYNKKTTNMLTIPPTLAVLGENAATWMNTGTMSNKGVELVMDYNSIKYGDFSWGASFNMSQYKNKLLSLNSSVTETGGDQRNIVGQPIGVFYGYVADGIFTTQDQVLNHATQPGAGVGRIIYRDLNHDGVVDANDQCVIGNPNPDFLLGLNIRLMYKQFTLSFFMNSALGFDIYNTTKRQLDFMTYDNIYDNRGTVTLNAWTPSNPTSKIPALSLLDNNNEMRTSTFFMEDGSYVQMKDLKLNYQIKPNQVLQKIGIKSFDLYGQVDNVFIISKYSGLSPVLPASGIDNGTYPIPRTYTMGISAKF
jgi:TonB-linked SusC/RagA family outer membrane protein